MAVMLIENRKALQNGIHNPSSIMLEHRTTLCMNGSRTSGASPRIFEWGDESSAVWPPTTQNTLKIGKDTGFGQLHSRIWWVRPTGFLQCSGGYEYTPSPPGGDAPVERTYLCNTAL